MTAPADIAPLLYTVPQALEALQMSRNAFYREVNAGRLCIVKQGRATRVTAEDLTAYIELLRQEARAAR